MYAGIMYVTMQLCTQYSMVSISLIVLLEWMGIFYTLNYMQLLASYVIVKYKICCTSLGYICVGTPILLHTCTYLQIHTHTLATVIHACTHTYMCKQTHTHATYILCTHNYVHSYTQYVASQLASYYTHNYLHPLLSYV